MKPIGTHTAAATSWFVTRAGELSNAKTNGGDDHRHQSAAADGRYIREASDLLPHRFQIEPHFLASLAQGRGQRIHIPRIHPASWECHMARPGIVRMLGALDKKELRPVLSGSQNCRHRGSRLPVLIGEKPRPKTAERGAELLDRQHGPYCGRNKRAWGVGRGTWDQASSPNPHISPPRVAGCHDVYYYCVLSGEVLGGVGDSLFTTASRVAATYA